MSVKLLLDRVHPQCTGWDRTGTRGLIKFVEEGQDELWSSLHRTNIFIDPSNKGFPPYLLTTAGTYTYDVTGANLSSGTLTQTIGGTAYTVRCKRVVRVFRDTSTGVNYDYGRRYQGRDSLYIQVNPFTNATSRIRVADEPVDSQPALENTTATVTFKDDPGTQTQTYFIEFEWEPMRLVSESIPLCIPLMFERALEDYVVGRVQSILTGTDSERLKKFDTYWKSEFSKEINQTSSSISTQIQKRFC